MNKETILKKAWELTPKDVRNDPEDDEIWEATEGDAHFKVTHETLPEHNVDFIGMGVSGPPAERQRIINDFIDALGSPDAYEIHPSHVGPIEFLNWLYKKTKTND